MSSIIPQRLVDTVKQFNDLAVGLFGITCTLFVPTNLTAVESKDMYASPADLTYKRYDSTPVWIEWSGKNISKLRKLGLFTENDIPIVARFKNEPEVLMGSYIQVETQYIPSKFDTDEFEVIDSLIKGLYDNEIYRYYKLAPRRVKLS